jgi:hypothetical protein
VLQRRRANLQFRLLNILASDLSHSVDEHLAKLPNEDEDCSRTAKSDSRVLVVLLSLQ